MKTYSIIDNQIIINPNTENEENLTETNQECKFCQKNPKTCGYKSPYCDWFKIKEDYKEI